MTEIPIPPMGGENIPLKELKPEKKPALEFQPQASKGSKLYILFIILLVVFFGGGIIFGLYIQPQQKQKELTATSPSSLPAPSPSPSVSPEPKGLEGKVFQFEKELEETDLEEEPLTPPTLDFNIRFKTD
jgi:hypothetical protein